MNLRDKLRDRYPIIAAHRGASRFAPENTIIAFDKALQLGAKAVELDVQMSLDHQIVVIHDATLERTTTGSGFVRDKTLAELSNLDAGRWFGPEFEGAQVPTLDQVLSLLKGRAFVNIELKPGHLDDVGFESRVIEVVRRQHMEDQVLFMSFDHVSIQRTKLLAPEILGIVVSGARLANEMDYLCTMGADGSNHSLVWWEQGSISQFHDEGFIVHASLINDEITWAEAKRLGIDMMDSDNPSIYGWGP